VDSTACDAPSTDAFVGVVHANIGASVKQPTHAREEPSPPRRTQSRDR